MARRWVDLWALRHTLLSEHTTPLRGEKHSVYQPVLSFSLSLLPLSFFFSSSVRKNLLLFIILVICIWLQPLEMGPRWMKGIFFLYWCSIFPYVVFLLFYYPPLHWEWMIYCFWQYTKMTCFKEVIRMPGAITGRCGSLRKKNALMHLFAKLVFFSFSKPIKENKNSFLLILFAEEKWTSQIEIWMMMSRSKGQLGIEEGGNPIKSGSNIQTSVVSSSQKFVLLLAGSKGCISYTVFSVNLRDT